MNVCFNRDCCIFWPRVLLFQEEPESYCVYHWWGGCAIPNTGLSAVGLKLHGQVFWI